jgi:hypothetical protein
LKKLLIISFLFIHAFCTGQTDSAFTLLSTVEGEFSFFTADYLGNLFLVNKNGQLKKLNVKGDSMGVFNDVRRYGKLYSIDAANPLKTLLFYKDFKTIVVLDRFLNVVNTIDLRKQNILQVRAISQSYDNNIWIFDEQESKLKKIGEDGKILSETSDFRLVFGEAPMPVRIIDQDKFVYLYDEQKGMFIFDYYGALKSKLPLTGWNNIQVINGNILGRLQNKILSYVSGTMQIKESVLPAKLQQADKIQITPRGVYVLDETGIRLYSLQ